LKTITPGRKKSSNIEILPVVVGLKPGNSEVINLSLKAGGYKIIADVF
jgi:hypothetical protein